MTFGFDFGLQILAEIPVSTWVRGLDGTLYSMMITDVINSLRFKGAVSRYSVIFCAFFLREHLLLREHLATFAGC